MEKITLEDELIKGKVSRGEIKLCPNCGILTEKDGGCNFLKCVCKTEWCFLCGKIKYSDDRGSESRCNDPTHNSH